MDITPIVIEVIKSIVGPVVSVALTVVFIRSERRKRAAEATQEENKARAQETDDADKVKKMAMEMAENWKKESGSVTGDNKLLREEMEKIRKMYYKLDGKLTRIVQLVKKDVEFRQATAGAHPEQYVAACLQSSEDMLEKIEQILAENGESK